MKTTLFFLTLSTLSFADQISNAPTRPITCNGDWVITAAALYWNPHQDGMEFAVDTSVFVPVLNPTPTELSQLNALINAKYQTPASHWEFGYKLGVGFNTTCDGWDIGILWTSFHSCSFSHAEAEVSDNHSLIPLWSSFSPPQGGITFARDIKATWKLRLNLVDLALGRAFWVSKRLSLRPFIGLRYGSFFQDFNLEHMGGSWSPRVSPIQDPLNNEVRLNNDYEGFGIHSGLETLWHFECGWSLYGTLATSILYGRFSIDHDEQNRLAISPHSKIKILENKAYFRASRAILDLALGLQWTGLFCNCKYAVTGRFGWEHYLFFHQNQMWRVVRIGNPSLPPLNNPPEEDFQADPNNAGENVFQQRRGTLSTQGWTLTLIFEF